MLSKSDYVDLQSINELPKGYYVEGERPQFLTADHEEFLLEIKCIRRKTLVPPGVEPEHPDGLSMFCVSPIGFYEMELFEERERAERFQKFQFVVTSLLALLALPGVLSGLVSYMHFLTR